MRERLRQQVALKRAELEELELALARLVLPAVERLREIRKPFKHEINWKMAEWGWGAPCRSCREDRPNEKAFCVGALKQHLREEERKRKVEADRKAPPAWYETKADLIRRRFEGVS